jgi:glutathione S-transferase
MYSDAFPESAMTSLILVSHHLCPYVQRAAIALNEKDVACERVSIVRANPPGGFLASSPGGSEALL